MATGGAAHRSDPGLTSSSHSLCGFKEESVPPPLTLLLLGLWLLLSPAQAPFLPAPLRRRQPASAPAAGLFLALPA